MMDDEDLLLLIIDNFYNKIIFERDLLCEKNVGKCLNWLKLLPSFLVYVMDIRNTTH